MTLDRSRLVACLEDVMLRTPRGSRGVVDLAYQGVRGRRTPLATPFTNLVGMAGPNRAVPDESIDAVCREFCERGLSFGWLLGPNSPKGLAARLVERGMVRAEGIEAAVIQAVRSTSAPICRSLGFEEVCSQELYAWSPP